MSTHHLSPFLAILPLIVAFYLIVGLLDRHLVTRARGALRLPTRTFKYSRAFSFIIIVSVLLTELVSFFGSSFWTLSSWPIFNVGTILVTINYAALDILTEVYGYERARRTIWQSVACALIILLVIGVTTDFFSHTMPAWRVSICSLTAFWIGSMSNSFIVSALKRHRWPRSEYSNAYLLFRLLASSTVGYLLDSAFFLPLAFSPGPWHLLFVKAAQNWGAKTLSEVPLALLSVFALIPWLKSTEETEIVDNKIDYWPFTIELGRGDLVSTIDGRAI